MSEAFCAVCKDVFETKNKNHVVCSNPDCKRKWYHRDKGENKPDLPTQKTEVFTETIRELIVEILEYRRPPKGYKGSIEAYISKQTGRSEQAVTAEIQRMRDAGEYEKYKRIVRLMRGKR